MRGKVLRFAMSAAIAKHRHFTSNFPRRKNKMISEKDRGSGKEKGASAVVFPRKTAGTNQTNRTMIPGRNNPSAKGRGAGAGICPAPAERMRETVLPFLQ